eukprot:2647377-Rhodomonas_salina.4
MMCCTDIKHVGSQSTHNNGARREEAHNNDNRVVLREQVWGKELTQNMESSKEQEEVAREHEGLLRLTEELAGQHR